MRLKAKIGPKGQVVIPKEIRELLGLKPGDEVIFETRSEGFFIRPAETGSTVDDLVKIIPKEEKLKEDIDIKRLILSEVEEEWSI